MALDPRSARLFWLILTWIAIGLGAVGAFLPLMPTTVFLLIALWTGSKASPRFRYRLFRHPRYGPALRDWHRHGVISNPARWTAAGAMALSVFVLWMAGASPSVLIAVGACLLLVAAWIFSRPSRVGNNEDE
ncbi:YbaN family protein [Wenzhouxiangella sediminis]|uniref:Inner membrane protein n=1 Tax=Wenzhouxiangella sediminis TaxID=1792836 RepID=A0A3E1K8Y6_9GAMM|nr:YbaN family protein [Wenzhouxiangella sediminis]RFF30539.1 DUF454 domain-containing protein [Wenzhouxiangella sediminis]